MIKKIWKYLLGGLAGAVLCGAVVGGVVSCSNGNQSKPTTSTAAYELTNRINTSAIAYKNPQAQPTNDIIMAATNQPDYSTLISEPNNVIINVLGTPEAVINVKNDTSNNVPDINLSLNPNSTLYQQVLNGTNTTTDLTKLNNLINFSTTTNSTDTFDINNLSVNSKGNVVQTNSWTFSLKDFVPTFGGGQYGNTSSYIGARNNGLTVLGNLNTFWTDIHAKNPTATFTFTNELYFYWTTEKNGKKVKESKEVPFNLTIDLLPLVQFSNPHPTIQITNQKTGAWELTNLPKEDAPEFIYTDGMWATNYNYAHYQTTAIQLPKTSVPYIYVNAQNMIVVGTTSQSVIK